MEFRRARLTFLPPVALPPVSPSSLVGCAALVLALEPALWLANSWFDPAYASQGGAVFLACLALFVWSVTSARSSGPLRQSDVRWGLGLLAASVLVRLAGQVLAINTLSALTLVIDVYALGLLCGLHRRARAVAPFWLAAAFAFTLPLERLVQRAVGYGLQHLSADGACLVLQSLFSTVQCEGVRVRVDTTDVLVDLPCSGAQAVLLIAFGFCLIAALVRPDRRQAVVGGVIAILAALVSNVLRIVLLAIGLARPDLIGGQNVMDQPWHDLIGLATLSMGVLPLVLWARLVGRRSCVQMRGPVPTTIAREGWWLEPSCVNRPVLRSRASGWVCASLALAGALAITHMPRQALDVARAEAPLSLPTMLAGQLARPAPLSDGERRFFTQFGGAAAKARYGPHSLLMVRTSSPLRHLHAPEDCLRGLGFRVTYLGKRFEPVPSAHYRAVGPDGDSYKIAVTFVSDQGVLTSNVATAVWHWLQGRDRHWTAVQRISPERNSADTPAFEGAVLAALELGQSASKHASVKGDER